MNKIWNLPNILSMFRILLVIPMGIALWNQENVIAVLIGILSSITDNLDGYFARRLNQITEFGKMIDPLSDKLFVGVIVIILLIQSRMPLWFALVIWGRDLLLMLGGLWASKKIGWVLPSNVLGKLTVTILGFTLMFIMLDIKLIATWGIWISTFFLTFSFVYYTIRMLMVLNKQNKIEKSAEK
jgi:CDP-diacylglycerol--glycerol-3-phosphate 3-phosphatidyltransferase